MQQNQKAIAAAFPHTIPVMAGYIFMGIAFGILLQSKGYGPGWAFLMSLTIYAGSMQFVAVGLLAGGFHPVQAALMTLMVNARHIFYGISMLEPFKALKRTRPYMIFSLTDETFSLLCSVETPEDVDRSQFLLAIAVMDHSYWIAGCTIGGILGSALPISSDGVDFVMTALFVTIFLEQWITAKDRLPALIGVVGPLLCLVVFGSQWFIIPAMAVLVLVLSLLRRPIEGRMEP